MTYLTPEQMRKNGYLDYANGARFSFRLSVALSEFASTVGAKFKVWRQRSRERQELAGASVQDLSDMGMSVPHAKFEANKPFWRA